MQLNIVTILRIQINSY